MKKATNTVKDLMFKPIGKMTGSELAILIKSLFDEAQQSKKEAHPEFNGREVAYGMQELADKLSCSLTRAYQLRNKCNLKDILLPSFSRERVYDVQKVRTLFWQLKDKERNEKLRKKNVVGYEAEG